MDIRKNDQLVVYDHSSMIGASRSYWMFRVFGLSVQVMDGPIKKWIDEGRPIESGPYEHHV